MTYFIEKDKAEKATPVALKNMNFHEMIDLGRVQILRVWCGWIYWSIEKGAVTAAVFVPQTSSEQ